MIKNDGFATYRTAKRIQTAYEKMLTIVERDQALREAEKILAEDDKRYSFRNSKNGMANDALSPYSDDLSLLIEQNGDIIVDSFHKLKQVVNLAFDNPNSKATAYFGIISPDALEKIKNNIPNLPKDMEMLFKKGKAYSVATTLDAIRHIADEKNLSREDVVDYLDRFADTILEFDSVAFDYYYKGLSKTASLLFKKHFEDGTLVSFTLVSNKKRSLMLQTIYLNEEDYKKKKVAKPLLMQKASAYTSKAQGGHPSEISIPQDFDSVNSELSEIDKTYLEAVNRGDMEMAQSNPDIRYSPSGRGYDGYSMSNNTREAYANGEKPLSRWSKADIVDAIADINSAVDASSSDEYSEYSNPITEEDVEILRTIGRKSINSFSSEDIKKAQKWAYKFYRELGVKSPFFRAWFGEWRAYDYTPIKIAIIPKYVASNEARKANRGMVRNLDTATINSRGWEIRISRNGETNTISHAGEQRLSEYGLSGIRELIESAVLFDSEVHKHHANNAPNEKISFDHKLYALGLSEDGTIGLYKITVEEYYQSKNEPMNKRFHNLRYIEKIAENIGGRTFGKDRSGGSTNDISAMYSISDLLGFVKQFDKDFVSAPDVSKYLLNADGTPRVFYHGTNAQFTVFEKGHKRTRGRLNLGEGFYFASSESYAKNYMEDGGTIIKAYVSIKNPYTVIGNQFTEWEMDDIRSKLPPEDRSKLDYGNVNDYLQRLGYDGVLGMNYSGTTMSINTVVVFNAERIKSATDNIGTFDSSTADIRYSPSAPDPNNPFDHVDTTMPKKEKLTLAQSRAWLKEFLESAQVELTNQQAAIENFLVRRGKMKRAEAASWVQAVRTSEGYRIGAVTTGQYSADGERVGDGLFQILSPLWDKKNGTWNEALYHEFAVYITNLHNIDRQREDKPVISYTSEEIEEQVFLTR